MLCLLGMIVILILYVVDELRACKSSDSGPNRMTRRKVRLGLAPIMGVFILLAVDFAVTKGLIFRENPLVSSMFFLMDAIFLFILTGIACSRPLTLYGWVMSSVLAGTAVTILLVVARRFL